MPYNSMNIKRLESLVTGIKEVTGCRMVTDSHGEIIEVHVTAESDRPPRLIARDVDTLLQVKAGLDIDYRKIGVVVTPPGNASAAAPAAFPAPASQPAERPREAAAELIVEDQEEAPTAVARVLFERIVMTHAEGRVTIEVSLRSGERRATGESNSADTAEGNLAAVIDATLEAVLMLYAPKLEFAQPHLKILAFGRDEIIVVYLSALEGRIVHTFTGSALIRQDPQQAAVLATLGALNRVLALWPEREGLDFEIV